MWDPIQQFNLSLRSTLSQIIHGTLPDPAWLQAALPLRLGGLGLREATPSVTLAFASSCSLSHSLIGHSSLDAAFWFTFAIASPSYLSIPPPSEASIQHAMHAQAELDAQRLHSLMSISSTHDRARYLALRRPMLG